MKEIRYLGYLHSPVLGSPIRVSTQKRKNHKNKITDKNKDRVKDKNKDKDKEGCREIKIKTGRLNLFYRMMLSKRKKWKTWFTRKRSLRVKF